MLKNLNYTCCVLSSKKNMISYRERSLKVRERQTRNYKIPYITMLTRASPFAPTASTGTSGPTNIRASSEMVAQDRREGANTGNHKEQ